MRNIILVLPLLWTSVRTFVPLFLLLMLSVTLAKAQTTLVDAKGTKISVDTSKWLLSGSDIYNKNTGTVGIGTNGVANSDAALEITATNKGLLVPRIALTDVTASTPLSAHVAGMMVYNTATAGSAPNNVVPGFYYNNGTRWVQVADPAMQDLRLVGNNNHITQDAGTGSNGTSVGTGTDNIAIGKSTLSGNTSGQSNVAIGLQASLENTTGVGNISIGSNAGKQNKTSSGNVAVGYSALSNNTARLNTAIGYQALSSNTIGTYNVGLGAQTLFTNDVGAFNIAIGNEALYNNQAGTRNIAIGYQALRANTTAYENIAIGFSALTKNATGFFNTALGIEALTNNTTGQSNTALGYHTLQANTAGGNNTAVGNLSLNTTTGNDNTAIGGAAGLGITSGSQNTIAGFHAAHTITSGSHNTVLGDNTGEGITTGNNNTVLGGNVTGLPANMSNNIIIADGQGNRRINVDSLGNVGLSTTAQKSRLDVPGYIKFGSADATADALSAAADRAGMVRYNSTSKSFQYHDDTQWRTMAATTSGKVDTTDDAWINDNANTQVKLGTLSDGITARPDTAAFLIQDNGRVGIGLTNPAGTIDLKGKLHVNNVQTLYNAGALNANFAGSLFIGNGGQNLVNNGLMEGRYNTGIGYNALDQNSSGAFNVATGSVALVRNTTGSNNAALGYASLTNNTIGTNNTAMGSSALSGNESGSYNTALGASALNQQVVGSYNTAVGYGAGSTLSNFAGTGANTFIGYNTGADISTGTNNTIVGANVTGLPANLSNNIIIADGQGNRRINVDSLGNVGLSTTAQKSRLDVPGYIKLGSTDATADALSATADRAGMVRYNSSSKSFQYHDDTQWRTMAATASSKADTTDDAWINDNANTQVKLGTLSDGTTPRPDSTVFVIKDNGKIGIGTTAPAAKMDVVESGSGTWMTVANLYAPNNAVGNNTMLRLGRNIFSKNTAEIRFNYTGDGLDANSLVLGFSGITNANATTIQAGGNVGIGTASPSAKLEVNGNVEINTVDNIGNDINYKPLVWNTSTKRVETTDDNTSVKKIITNVGAGSSADIGSPLTASSGVAGYEIKILVANGCVASAYNKFIASGSNAGLWRINFMAGISQNGPSSGVSSGNGATVTVTNPLSGGCADGGNATALNYTLNITNAGQLSITNNGNIARNYTVIIEKVIE